MLFPCSGKVLVIDDQIEEAMPLLKLLGKNGVPAMYYSGNSVELPETPFEEIRLIFCDLKFNAASDPKSVASNVISILRALVSEKNGPFILLVWSAHGNDYIEALREMLEKTAIKPEFIMQLDKADFFESKDNCAVFDSLIDRVSDLDLDIEDEKKVQTLIREHTISLKTVTHIAKDNALEEISVKLTAELQKANLFHLFVLWENTIGSSAVQTVNNIYSAIPETIPAEKRLRAMLFYLASHRLEKQVSESSEPTKFEAALDSLNEMFSYFYTENVRKITLDQVTIDKIQDLKEIKELSPAKFNQWKMITFANKGKHPGNVYRDADKRFRYHGLINANNHTNSDKYDSIVEELGKNTDAQYVLIDLSAECDIAQNKIFISRVVPGVMIPEEDAKTYITGQKLKSDDPDYIFKLYPVEFQGKSWYIAFNVNQMFALEMDKLRDEDLLFALTSSYITNLKQKAAGCISKQGVEVFAASR